MKIKHAIFFTFLLSVSILFGQSEKIDKYKSTNGTIEIQPILHGSLIISYNGKTIYIDPYGGGTRYEGINPPDIIIITDIHGDHLDLKTLNNIDTSNSIFIAPQAVSDKLPEQMKLKNVVLNNGQSIHRLNFYIQAIPMYNLPEINDSKHTKGRGNGYIITIDNTRIYVSGDTEDIQEMRDLKNIDIAFICMNLPYTMDIHQAASAVLEFKPKIVYPYHYRGRPDMSDTSEFKQIVQNKDKGIDVRIRNWYPAN